MAGPIEKKARPAEAGNFYPLASYLFLALPCDGRLEFHATASHDRARQPLHHHSSSQIHAVTAHTSARPGEVVNAQEEEEDFDTVDHRSQPPATAVRGRSQRHTEALVATSALTIRGLEPLPVSTRALDPAAMAMEHVLASLARVEARLEENDRRFNSVFSLSHPDPDPPNGMPRG
ncbi:hypothetical protein SASPL_136025 [Salvia splendens]|uniref:Uncharacterized protein n=1 Tax=Salvia splendens TaxID=180675 RepID=A0A8X8WZ19_SALSN|nr:hypothetical protein SASPL_136025 [Salvia splendens]